MIIDHAKRAVKFKIVYHGPALAGKTTNVTQIAKRRSKELLSFDTKEERTLVFDMTTEERKVGDFRATFIIYTVPGQHIYSDIRKMVMRGADGVVFVADSSKDRLNENKEFFKVLEEDLSLYGKSVGDTPVVIQYNKRDLPDALAKDTLERELNPMGLPSFEAVALRGEGVEETLEGIISEILNRFGRLLR
ncbi:MAG: gliding motility protein [Aquificae bacterium]|nr:gliding motility protein [Aquificota bacterium]